MTEHKRLWDWSDNPADPCVYCVRWLEPPFNNNPDLAVPAAPDGNIVTHLWHGIHVTCNASVAAYTNHYLK